MLAVRLLAGIAQSHAFAQGNKRTCFVAMVQFLNANGYDLAVEDSAAWASTIIAWSNIGLPKRILFAPFGRSSF